MTRFYHLLDINKPAKHHLKIIIIIRTEIKVKRKETRITHFLISLFFIDKINI